LAAATLVLAMQALVASPICAGESIQMMEQSIKAGLLYNFLKYTEWPQEDPAASTATVCIFGKDPFRGSLQPMTKRTVNQRPIALRRMDDIQETAGCHLLFVNADEKAQWPQLSEFLAEKSVLTVSDMGEFASLGGMIEFGQKDDRIDVRINMEALTSARLQVQERLLSLGHVVRAASH
jgi:hypothetical protein